MKRLALWFAVWVLAGCVDAEDGPRLIEGTTSRIGAPVQGEDTELHLEVFTSRSDCLAALGEAAADDCVPQIDRGTGQVRRSFRTRAMASMLRAGLGSCSSCSSTARARCTTTTRSR